MGDPSLRAAAAPCKPGRSPCEPHSIHLSLSHDAGIASAMVVAEAIGEGPHAGRPPVDEVRAAEGRLSLARRDGELMVRAATGLAATCAQLLIAARGGVYGTARGACCAARGNNGGDASLCRRAARQAGGPTCVVVADRPARCTTVAVRRCSAAGWSRAWRSHEAAAVIDAADLVIDGMVGHRGHRSTSGNKRQRLAEQATISDALVVAVDLPSGVDADTGVADDTAVWADVTVTFGLMKPGLLLSPGSDARGSARAGRHRAGRAMRSCRRSRAWRTSTSRRMLPRPGPARPQVHRKG